MDLKGWTLEDWFFKRRITQFPKRIDYKERYRYIKQHLRDYIQNNIMIGAVISESQKESGTRSTLTGHGPQHFDTVVDIVSKLVSSELCELTPYEVFILLTAIQIHDIGVILGRKNHEMTAIEVFHDVFKNDTSLDAVENKIVFDVAQAHSGAIDGEKDKIGTTVPRITSHNHSDIRTQYIAAILRFADELADEPERSLSYLYQKGRIEPGSEIFHEYAESLKSTNIHMESNEINLTYKFQKDNASKKFWKNSERVYLLDEIFRRNLKMHLEKIYCMKFMRPEITIDHINIEILAFSTGFKEELIKIDYRLAEKGYPQSPGNGIIGICEDAGKLLAPNGKEWNGILLKKYLRNYGS